VSTLRSEEKIGTTIDFWFQFQHRRLRERFSMETLTRHEGRLLDALYARRQTLRSVA
jgi:hypothetical protein